MANLKHSAAQFDFEYMGKSLEELSAQYGFPMILMSQMAANWSRRIERLPALPETTDIVSFAEALERRTRQQLTVVALFKQVEQQPLLAMIEKLILEKTFEVLNNITHMDDKAATKITALVNAITTLRQQDPVLLADKVKDLAASGGLVVNIQNNVT